MSVLGELEFLYQIDVDFSLENEMLKRPNDVPNCGNHVFVGVWVDLHLVLDDFHSLDLVRVVVPYSLG